VRAGTGPFDSGTRRLATSWEFRRPSSGVTALAVRPDGQRFVSADSDNRLRWWNPADGATVNYGNGHSAQVNDITFSKDGKQVASASATTQFAFGHKRRRPTEDAFRFAGLELLVAISPDSRFVAAGGGDGVCGYGRSIRRL